jgi:hypothetical protein
MSDVEAFQLMIVEAFTELAAAAGIAPPANA